ncbi:MAG: PDZ domain-containing protein [Myxococcales bacterium]|nr:PDZ domain-containing protein [Myxococcales bacterium]MCB9530227.1 PDZ domain-containing protein [Myxococcales bacterium]MCB9533740.1 PDZ domain-containing protein [Myxococcales bacterium]
MRSTAYIRYSVAAVALMLGFALSIRMSERGFLFESRGALATASVAEGGYDLQALTVVNRVVGVLGDSYVEPERIDPARMLVHALDRVQNAVPEVVTLFDADIDASPESVEVRVGAASSTFSISGIESLWEMTFKLREIFAFVQRNVDPDEVDLQEVEYEAINGMLSTLDPHSVLLDPKVYADMQAQNQGEFGGLGIVISIRDNQLTVISPIDDTPASRAGFRAGDRIVKINSESTVNMPLDEAVGRLRGPPGTTVSLEVMRAGWTEPHSFDLTREQIQIESVTHEALGDGVGYVNITNFQARTHDDMMEALAALQAEMGPLRGLILDLRNNPGGLLQQAIAVSDTFIASGTIVTTVGIGDRLREESNATAPGTQSDYPIVVLVNPGSASASEIVAGALKNHNRALIVGDTTFGKGSVQVINSFADGSALKVTIAKYLTPGDVSIQGVGIVPDIRVVPVSIDDEFIDLYSPEHVFREGDLEQSLTSQHIAAEPDRPSATVKYYFEPTETDPNAVEDPDAFEMDFEIGLARQLLLAVGDETERGAMLARSAGVVEQVSAEQLLEVQERLRNRNVDWATGQNVIQPVRLEASTSPTGGRVHAGDPVTITLRATNDGTRPLYQVRAVSRSDYELFDDREFVFGRLDPGRTVEWSVTIPVPREDPSRVARVRLKAYADLIELGAETDAFVEVVGTDRPHWALAYQVDDSDGNGDGLLQTGETVRLNVDVTNTGDVAAAETIVSLRNKSDAAMFLVSGRDTVPELAPGAAHRSTFEFQVHSVPEDGVIDAQIFVYDTVFRELLTEDLEFPVTLPDAACARSTRSGRATFGSATQLRGGASEQAVVVGEAPAGASLPVTAACGDFVRVDWDGGHGWVDTGAVELGDPLALPPSAVEPVWTVRPPRIELAPSAVRTSDPSFQLFGSVSDDGTVRDFYVVVTSLVSEYRTQRLKFDYRYLGAQSGAIDERIPLRAGTNEITIVARDDEGTETRASLYVYRDE